MKVIRISLIITNNGNQINYTVLMENGTQDFYTENTVPYAIIRYINYRDPVFTYTSETGEQIIIYEC